MPGLKRVLGRLVYKPRRRPVAQSSVLIVKTLSGYLEIIGSDSRSFIYLKFLKEFFSWIIIASAVSGANTSSIPLFDISISLTEFSISTSVSDKTHEFISKKNNFICNYVNFVFD